MADMNIVDINAVTQQVVNVNASSNIIAQVNMSTSSFNPIGFLLKIPSYILDLFKASPFVVLILVGIILALQFLVVSQHIEGNLSWLISFFSGIIIFALVSPFLLPIVLPLVVK